MNVNIFLLKIVIKDNYKNTLLNQNKILMLA